MHFEYQESHKLWVIELFHNLGKRFECLEVVPVAVAVEQVLLA